MSDSSKALLFTKSHEWVLTEDNVATIGITDYAQQSLGDLVYVELPEVGINVHTGDELGIIESVKAASDFYAPVSGKIIAINESVSDEPALINSSAEDAGWLVKIELSSPDELSNLMTIDDYTNLTNES